MGEEMKTGVKKGYKQTPEHIRKRAEKMRNTTCGKMTKKPNEELLRKALEGRK